MYKTSEHALNNTFDLKNSPGVETSGLLINVFDLLH